MGARGFRLGVPRGVLISTSSQRGGKIGDSLMLPTLVRRDVAHNERAFPIIVDENLQNVCSWLIESIYIPCGVPEQCKRRWDFSVIRDNSYREQEKTPSRNPHVFFQFDPPPP